ncbi:gliding motility-associated ABC transporter substrate-binding protein GldG [Ferruginibacter sp. HRS2-29]|uniref:gliding motility-associated ABC transporter substrate-binding protein GldG n=1 Tax=Ferruginibacter sp. HRS2-29 TaxID=2487334 RepID=UPI0020CF1A41|nr:gliding motility-associated ABC transporter substrate-binding protein GldG [Ferruginibacter sp. HRS2-29]MCP9751684.1 gliding motility-associated ABC transporter substrate-binding protein GldG [Ferruginibacter sp. HRS2-29]
MSIFRSIYKKAWLPVALLILVSLNWAASVWHSRLDFTDEKRFTLSHPTRKLLRNIKEPVTIDVFLKGNYPSGFKKLASSTADILQEFKEVAGARVRFNFKSLEDVVPGTGVTYNDTLPALGFNYINLTSQVEQGQQQQVVYPIALVYDGNDTIPVTIFEKKAVADPSFKNRITSGELNSAEATLEYKFADAISKISRETRPIVGYAIGNGEPVQINTYDLVENILRPEYDVFTFDPNSQPRIPEDFKVLMVVKPAQGFSEEAKLKLDQYVMGGGKLLMFVDRLNAELDSLQKGEVVAYDRELNLNDLLFKYGVRINPDLVMDLQCDFLPFDVNGNGQFELLPWNYFPVLESPSNNPINKNLGFVAGRFVNSIDTIETEGIKKTILLTSSPNARTIATPAIISGKENSVEPENAKYNKPHIPVAVLLEGKFSSLYANRVTQAMNDSITKYGATFIPQSGDNKMVIVSDGDIVLNSVIKGEPIPMGMNPYTYGTQRAFPFANKDFIQNCLDYLINENDLSEAKSKDYVVRLLDSKKVEEEKKKWQLINIGLPVLLVLLFAFIFQWLRKRRYTK